MRLRFDNVTAPIGRSHLEEAPTAAWYRFSPDRKGARPREHLANYTGFMHADGYAGFEELYRSGRVHEVTCTLALSVPNAEVAMQGPKIVSDIWAPRKMLRLP